MRRTDREVSDKEEIKLFISRERVIRVGFYDNGEIYIVPVNYGFTEKEGKWIFYFHGANSGRKFDLSQSQPQIGFEIDGNYKLIESDLACDFANTFQSLIGTGKISIVDSIDEKVEALNLIMKQAVNFTGWKYDETKFNSTAVYKIEVAKMTCKARK